MKKVEDGREKFCRVVSVGSRQPRSLRKAAQSVLDPVSANPLTIGQLTNVIDQRQWSLRKGFFEVGWSGIEGHCLDVSCARQASDPQVVSSFHGRGFLSRLRSLECALGRPGRHFWVNCGHLT